MKKRGFTIPEVLIAMTIIGVIAVIVFAVVQRITPDSDKAMIKKAYYTAEEVTADLLNNNWVYPDCEACSTKAQCNGKTYYGLDDDRSATHQGVIYLSGATKYPQLFAAKLNAKYNITTNSFATPDGIIYDFSNIVSTPWVHGATIESSGNPYITVTLPSNISFKVHVLVNGKMYINKDDKAAVEAVTAHNIFNKTTPVTSDPAAYTRSYSDNDCKGCPENETKVQGYCIPNDKICNSGTGALICGQCINPATVQQCSGKDSAGNYAAGIMLGGSCTNIQTCQPFPPGWTPSGPDTPPGLPNVQPPANCPVAKTCPSGYEYFEWPQCSGNGICILDHDLTPPALDTCDDNQFYSSDYDYDRRCTLSHSCSEDECRANYYAGAKKVCNQAGGRLPSLWPEDQYYTYYYGDDLTRVPGGVPSVSNSEVAKVWLYCTGLNRGCGMTSQSRRHLWILNDAASYNNNAFVLEDAHYSNPYFDLSLGRVNMEIKSAADLRVRCVTDGEIISGGGGGATPPVVDPCAGLTGMARLQCLSGGDTGGCGELCDANGYCREKCH